MNRLSSYLLVFTALATANCGGDAGPESSASAAPGVTGTPNDSDVPNQTDRATTPSTPNASNVPNDSDVTRPDPTPEPSPGPGTGDVCTRICDTGRLLQCSLVGQSGDCVADCRRAEGMECGPELFAAILCSLENGTCPEDVDDVSDCLAEYTAYSECDPL